MNPLPSDEQLVLEVLGGQPERYAELVRRHEPAARATALAILRHRHAAEDVVQTSFVTAYRKLAMLRCGSSFGFWLLRITRREAFRTLRQKKNIVTLEGIDFPSGDSDTAMLAPDDEQKLTAAIAELPEYERVVVALHYFQGLSVIEVARVLSRPVGTVTKQISRAHMRLRQRLSQWTKE